MACPVKHICLRGHNIAEVGRYPNGDCRECSRRRVRAWKAANAARVKADDKADRQAYAQAFGFSLRTYYYRKLLQE